MADKKISELTAAGALTGAEILEIVQGGVNKQTTTQDIANLGGGGGTWGSITGTLSDQTDLQSALNGKIPVKVRADVTLANGVVTINWAAGDIQNLTISEAKVITTISNPIVGETIILIIPGTNSLTFSGLTAVIEGTYNVGVENRIYIQCLKVSGGAEYRITYDSNLSPFPYSTLTSSSNITTWAVSSQEWFSKRSLTLTENSTFSMSGILNGYQGECWVNASGGVRTISIPAGTGNKMMGVGDNTVKIISIPSGATYIVWWDYDGTTTRWGYIEE